MGQWLLFQQEALLDLRAIQIIGMIVGQENNEGVCDVFCVVRLAITVQAVPALPELQEAVAKLCHSWWQLDAPGKETLVLQTLPFMFVKALLTGMQHL